MKIKLFMLLALFACLPMFAQNTGVQGVVIDARSGAPVPGATVMFDNQNIAVTTGPEGDFRISTAAAGRDVVTVLGYGYKDHSQSIEIINGIIDNLGTIRLEPSSSAIGDEQHAVYNDVVLSETQVEDEEGTTQNVATLSGATDNPFYQSASYDFSLMRFRIRGYNSEYTDTYINGVAFNDAMRGRFNYSMIGGMNQAFKAKSIGMGLAPTSYGFGGIGGANNIRTFAKDYAPGFRGSVAYTNGNYQWRGMATYSTGLMKNGWAITASAVGRYAHEGIIKGSFYNSWGYFLAVQKVFNPQHSLSLTTFGAPTKRASNSATFEEAYDLAGTHLYNANWGWQEGKKRNARVVEAFDPTAILNWVWTPKAGTTLNTGIAFHKSFYSSSALNWYNARDPRPDYYRYLPSYFASDPDTYQLYTDLWRNSEDMRQLDWQGMYQVNYLNALEAERTGKDKGSTYIVEKRHSNLAVWQLNSTLNHRFNDKVTLQGGVGAGYTVASYYKTMKDLLGGTHWLDIDQYAERDFPGDASLAQNDMDNPNRKIYKGDRFGYDYNIYSVNANIWKQVMINLAHWDINYTIKASYTNFQRDGKMRNGRSPENSKGRGRHHEFMNVAFKAGATYKLDGRNTFTGNIYYGTHAPLPYNAYISPRTKDDAIANLNSEKVFSADLSYALSLRRFKAVVTAFFTDQRDATERTAFYDDLAATFMNYALTGVHKVYKGIEIGASFKILPSLTLSGAANIARYQYKNRPQGTRSYENGSQADVTQTVYLKNFYVGGTPQEAYSLSLNWAAPKMWFFEVSGTYMNKAYVDLSPVRHEASTVENLWTLASSEDELRQLQEQITTQEKLNSAFVLGASIGHVIYLNRRASLNININLDNILNKKDIMTGGYQQGRFDYKTFSTSKYPNKYYFAQGFKIYVNVGVRF